MEIHYFYCTIIINIICAIFFYFYVQKIKKGKTIYIDRPVEVIKEKKIIEYKEKIVIKSTLDNLHIDSINPKIWWDGHNCYVSPIRGWGMTHDKKLQIAFLKITNDNKFEVSSYLNERRFQDEYDSLQEAKDGTIVKFKQYLLNYLKGNF